MCSNSVTDARVKVPSMMKWQLLFKHLHGCSNSYIHGLLCSHCDGFLNGDPKAQKHMRVIQAPLKTSLLKMSR